MKRTGIPIFLLLLLVGLPLLVPSISVAEDPMRGPWDWPTERSASQKKQLRAGASASFFASMLAFFQKVISPVDGDRCPSYPTCAAYSKEAYEKHGALIGTFMTVDRLFHEASEAKFSPTVEVYGVPRIYDPVSANEYWKKDRKKQPAE